MSKFGLLLVSLLYSLFTVKTASSSTSNLLCSLPDDIFFKLFDYGDLKEIRGTCRELKRRFEDYLQRCKFKDMKYMPYGLIRTWQLTNLLNYSDKTQEIDSRIRIQAYKPMKSKNHVKLIQFLAAHSEFAKLFASMKADVKGFINPIIAHYKNRIHGLDEFVETVGCEHLLVDKENSEADCAKMDWEHELEGYLMIFEVFRCLQG